jgi:hypothetical protein
MVSNKKLSDSIINISKVGYASGSILDSEDLKKAQEIISLHISKLNNENISFEDILLYKAKGLEDIAINKSKRIFTTEDAKIFLSLPTVKSLISEFPLLKVSNALDPIKGLISTPEVYFRIVRPNTGGNPSAGHIDFWYDDLYKLEMNVRPRLKVWISLFTEPGKNGLLLKSKKDSAGFHYNTIQTSFGPRPSMIEPPDISSYDFPFIMPGDGVIFDCESVLHLGAPNNGQLARVSVEIALRNR